MAKNKKGANKNAAASTPVTATENGKQVEEQATAEKVEVSSVAVSQEPATADNNDSAENG